MQNASLENISLSSLKNFLIKLSTASNRHTKKEHIAYSETQFENAAKKELIGRIQQLEKELQQAKEERDKALNENRNDINELGIALLSIKARMNEILEAKKERECKIKQLEAKIRRMS